MIRKLQILFANISIKFLVVLTPEREFTAKQSEEKDAKGPDIGRWSRVLNFGHDLRRHVRGCATEDLYFPLVWDTSRKAEINQFNYCFCLIE